MFADPCPEGELNPAIVRETFDSSQPRPMPLPTQQNEANALPTPQLQPLSPSADFASTSQGTKPFVVMSYMPSDSYL